MKNSIKPFYILLALVLLVAGCVPGAPTPSPEEIAAQVATSVAMTVQAQAEMAKAVAETVAAQQPAATPTTEQTDDSAAIPTLTPVLPTATPIVIVPPASGGSGSGGGSTAPAQYACDIIHQRPFDNSVFRKNDPFDVKWTIVNTGTATWPLGYDLAYFSGPHMIQNPVIVQLPEMKPGAQFVVPVFDAFATSDTGFKVETWKLEGGFCYPYIAINVK